MIKTPTSRPPTALGAGQQPAGTAAGSFTMDSALGLWKAYGPAVMTGLSRSPVQPVPSPSASSTSLQPNAPNAERRPSSQSINSTPTGTPDVHSGVP